MAQLRCILCGKHVKQDGVDAIEFQFGPYVEDLKPFPNRDYVHAECYRDKRLVREYSGTPIMLEDIFGVL
jgi:hypothetical protein